MNNKESEKLREEIINEFRKQTRSHTIDNRGLDIPITVDERDLLVDIAIQKAREEKDKERKDVEKASAFVIRNQKFEINKLKAEIQKLKSNIKEILEDVFYSDRFEHTQQCYSGDDMIDVIIQKLKKETSK